MEVKFCNLIFNFTETSDTTLDIHISDSSTKIIISKFILEGVGKPFISLDQLEEYSHKYEINNKKVFDEHMLNDSLITTQLGYFNVNVGDIDIFHYKLKDINSGKVSIYHASCLDFVSQSISIAISHESFKYINKIKASIGGVVKAKQAIALKIWSFKKIKRLIKSNIYNFVNRLWGQQNFRSSDCVNRYISVNRAAKLEIMPFQFSPGFCAMYCNELLDDGLYHRIFHDNAFVRCLGSMSFSDKKFYIRCPQKKVSIEDLFNDSLFLKSLYNNFPLNAGHISDDFIYFIFNEKSKIKTFDYIDFNNKTKYYKITWMHIYIMYMRVNINKYMVINDSFIKKCACPNELKNFLKEHDKKNKTAKNKSVLSWLTIRNINNAIASNLFLEENKDNADNKDIQICL